MSFEDLPLEMKLKIFSYLHQDDLLTISGVCRSFREAAYDPALWKSVVLYTQDSERKFSDSFASFVHRSGTLLEKLRVDFNNSDDSQRLFTLLPELPKLKTLKLRFPFETEDCVVECITNTALMRCPNVEYFEAILAGRYSIGRNIPELQFLRHVEIYCSRLNPVFSVFERCFPEEIISVGSPRHAKWSECDFLVNCSRFCQTLKSVQLFGVKVRGEDLFFLKECTGLTELSIFCLTRLASDHLMVLKCFPCLRKLELRVIGANLRMTRAVLELFSGPAMKNLRVLYFKPKLVDEECVESIALCCPNLEKVSLFCFGNYDSCIRIFKEHCKLLTRLDFRSINSFGRDFWM